MTKFVKPLGDSPLLQRMVRGHLIRVGHPLDAVLVSDDGELWVTVRLCCGETIPAKVKTYEDTVQG